MSYSGFSKQTKLDIANLSAQATQSFADAGADRSQMKGVVSALDSKVDTRVGELNASIADAEGRLSIAINDLSVAKSAEIVTVQQNIATEIADRVAENTNIRGELNTAVARLDTFDVELKSKVDTIATDAYISGIATTVVEKLEADDASLNTAIAQAITDRETKDAEHTAKLNNTDANFSQVKYMLDQMMLYLSAFEQTYTVEDASGNAQYVGHFAQLKADLANQIGSL